MNEIEPVAGKRPRHYHYTKTTLKKLYRIVFSVLKWILIVIVGVECFSFLAITTINYVLYGNPREGISTTRYDAYSVFLNSKGPRPTDNNSVSPDAKLNRTVWLFGGSTMRGRTTDDSMTLASFMSEILNREGAPLHFTIINFGMDSFNSLLEAKYLQKVLIEARGSPHVIIFYDGANDATYLALHQDPRGHHGYRRLRALIESYHESFFGLFKQLNAAWHASFSGELLNKFRWVAVPFDKDSPVLDGYARSAELRYDYLNKVAACVGAKFFAVWQPILWTEECEVPKEIRDKEEGIIVSFKRFEILQHNFKVPYRIMIERLKYKPYFFDFTSILCSRTAEVYQADGVHLTDYGRRIVARGLVDLLNENSCLRSIPP